jgi:hypothetical protein
LTKPILNMELQNQRKDKRVPFYGFKLPSLERTNQDTVDDTRFSTSDSSIIFTGFVM